jgi:hypothetical protein
MTLAGKGMADRGCTVSFDCAKAAPKKATAQRQAAPAARKLLRI